MGSVGIKILVCFPPQKKQGRTGRVVCNGSSTIGNYFDAYGQGCFQDGPLASFKVYVAICFARQNKARRAANVHQNMCTIGRALVTARVSHKARNPRKNKVA